MKYFSNLCATGVRCCPSMSSEIILLGPTVFIRLGAPGAYYTFRP